MVASVNGSDLGQSAVRMEESPDPPLQATYKNLFDDKSLEFSPVESEECELPIIDLNHLYLGDVKSRQACKKQICCASREWGFFQVINHGISPEILERMRAEQVKLFKKPFKDKTNSTGLNFSPGSYRWGTPSATSLNQLSWSEAFHVSLSDVLGSDNLDTLSLVMEQFTVMVSGLAHRIVDILAEEICQGSARYFRETCVPSTCYLRLNRYPACPADAANNMMYGIMPHTDSDFITVLQQDDVGGLQLVRDGKWFAVRPNPEALIINIGDLFQAWSNDVYRSVEHRVVANPVKERFSMAYFFCPSYETVIETTATASIYTSFSFGEYRKQVEQDVKILGRKIGLPRFRVQTDHP